jgi:NAD(P)-dependent dehydrogenase (short-subunit alcohol dehydrogenase family)
MTGRLEGKAAVVLGCSASGGTGWAIAEGLAAEGARVMVAARSLAPLEKLAARIGGIAQVCDVAEPLQVKALADAARAAFGTIDIAVNAAGLPAMGTIADIGGGDIQATLDVNYIGNIYFIRHMAAAMNDGGAITLISSSSAAQPMAPFFAYACAKAAMDCLVRYAALEYGPRGIRVNSVLPGPIRSDMAKDLWAVPGMEAVFNREVPLGRIGEPGDYADAVVWLSGPAFVTGLNLPVSGGNHLTRSPRLDEMPAMPG